MRYSLYRFPSPLVLLRGQQGRVFNASLIILLSLLISRGLGIVRDRLLTTFFFGGLESQLDVYYAAFRIPDTLYQLLISSVIAAGFLPLFSQKLVRESRIKAFNFALITIMSLMTAFWLTLLLLKPFWVNLLGYLAPGFDAAQQQIFLTLTPYIIVAQLILALSNLSVLILQTHDHYIAPALSPLMYNLGIIGGIIFLSPRFQVLGLAYGVLLGSLGHLLIQLPVLVGVVDGRIKIGLITLDEVKDNLGKLVRLSWPNTLSILLIQTEVNWLTRLASFLSAGSLSLFNFANNLIQLPISIFALALGQAIYPRLALSKSRLDSRRFLSIFEKALHQTVFIVTPLIILFVILRLPIVRLVLGSKSFSWANTVIMSRLVLIMVPVILAHSLSVTFQKIFLSLGQSRFILVAQLASTITFVGLTLWLLPGYHNVYSLAWAISVAAVVKFLLGALLLIKENGGLGRVIKNSYRVFAKIALAGLVSFWLAWGSYRLGNIIFNTAYTINLLFLIIFVTLITLISYGLLSYWVGLKPFFFFINQVGRLLSLKLSYTGGQND